MCLRYWIMTLSLGAFLIRGSRHDAEKADSRAPERGRTLRASGRGGAGNVSEQRDCPAPEANTAGSCFSFPFLLSTRSMS